MSDEKHFNLGMRDILTATHKPFGEVIGDYFKAIFTTDWIFDRPVEKIIVALSFLWTLATIILFILKILVFK